MMFQIKNKKHHPKGWCFSELAFRANSPGAEDGTCLAAARAVAGSDCPRQSFTTGPSSPVSHKSKKYRHHPMGNACILVRKTGLARLRAERLGGKTVPRTVF